MRDLFFLLLLVGVFSCSEPPNNEDVVQQVAITDITELPLDTTRLLFRYEVSNPSNKLIKNTSISIAIPNAKSSRHQLTALDINITHSIVADELGNQNALILFDDFAPFDTKIITIKAELTPYLASDITLMERPETIAESEMVPYLAVDIQAIAKQFKGQTEKELITQSYDWVVSHLNYAGYIPDDRGALYALHKGRGDCTEYMYLLAALLRANSIPTRLVAGYVYSKSQLAHASDYHNWVEVFIDGQWLVVDAQKERLLVNSSDYISMRYLDSPVLLIQQSQRFLVSDTLKVKMY